VNRGGGAGRGGLRIGVIARDTGHPLLAGAAAVLRQDGHAVVAGVEGVDAVLLKARSSAALELAGSAETSGVPVLNSVASTAFCQDRLAMARLTERAGLPFAATGEPVLLGRLRAGGGPVVVKSRYSRRGDLVARIRTDAELAELAERWADEEVVVQDDAGGDGWDHKLWVVNGRLFAALRRSELADGDPAASRSLSEHELPLGYRDLAMAAGEAFGLDVYGVDVLDVAGTPVIVDVNAFPGIRGQAGAPEALAALAVDVATGRHVPRVLSAAATLTR